MQVTFKDLYANGSLELELDSLPRKDDLIQLNVEAGGFRLCYVSEVIHLVEENRVEVLYADLSRKPPRF